MLSMVIKARCDHGTVSHCRRTSAQRRWGWASTHSGMIHRLESTFLKNGARELCESDESRRSAELIQHTFRRDVIELQIHFHTETVGGTDVSSSPPGGGYCTQTGRGRPPAPGAGRGPPHGGARPPRPPL